MLSRHNAMMFKPWIRAVALYVNLPSSRGSRFNINYVSSDIETDTPRLDPGEEADGHLSCKISILNDPA